MKSNKNTASNNFLQSDDQSFLMTNLVQELTGLPFNIWIASKEAGQEASILVQGDYSIKLRNDIVFKLTIADDPKVSGHTGEISENDINLAKMFVRLNKDVLLDYWNEVDIDVVRVIFKLNKVGK